MSTWGEPLSEEEFVRMQEVAKKLPPPRTVREVFQYENRKFSSGDTSEAILDIDTTGRGSLVKDRESIDKK